MVQNEADGIQKRTFKISVDQSVLPEQFMEISSMSLSQI